MKALLICPAKRPGVAALSEGAPLVTLALLGRPVIEHWLEHLAKLGARHIYILAADRPEQVREVVGGGEQWGVKVEVIPEICELTPGEAHAKYRAEDPANWLSAPDEVAVADHLPGMPEQPLFVDYEHWLVAHLLGIPQAIAPQRVGVKEIRPGIWAGLHTRISPTAELRAPCWLGENVTVGPGAVIGPLAILENRVVVGASAGVSHSVIGADTLVGDLTEIHVSLALGNRLIQWQNGTCLTVTDNFILSSLAGEPSVPSPVTVPGRLAAALALLVTAPLALVVMLRSWFRRQSAFQPMVGLRPAVAGRLARGETMMYFELRHGRGWLRRWPQLWEIMRGEFSWVGNRPISPERAARWSNESERQCLAAPVGLISLADAEGCHSSGGEETHAYDTLYAARRSSRLEAQILAKAAFIFAFGYPFSRLREQFSWQIPAASTEEERAR